jgi:hypothetical protein
MLTGAYSIACKRSAFNKKIKPYQLVSNLSIVADFAAAAKRGNFTKIGSENEFNRSTLRPQPYRPP